MLWNAVSALCARLWFRLRTRTHYELSSPAHIDWGTMRFATRGAAMRFIDRNRGTWYMCKVWVYPDTPKERTVYGVHPR